MSIFVSTASVLPALTTAALAQAPLHTWIDWELQLQPSSVAPAGDWNGDGIPELFLGAFSGRRVGVVSGTDRELLLRFPTVHLPLHIAATRDLDGDGVADLLTGELYEPGGGIERGAARLYSGASGALIREFLGHLDDGNFGAGIDNLGDVDGDSFDDIAAVSMPVQVGTTWTPPYGGVFSGRTGALLFSYTANGHRLALNAAGDVDGDGYADVLRTDAEEFVTTILRGRARILSGRTGALILDFVGRSGETNFGTLRGPAGDLDSDGSDDVLLGPATASPTNSVRVHSGADGSVLLELSMANIGSSSVVASHTFTLGEADGDGVPDIALLSSHGVLDAFSGATGALIYRMPLSMTPYGISTPVDLNNDGLNDLAMAGFIGSTHGYPVLYAFASGWPTPRSYCVTQTNAAGCTPRIVSLSGGTSVHVGDPLELTAVEVDPAATGILLWSSASAAIPFHGGTLCVAPGPMLRRTPVHSSIGHATYPCAGTLHHVLRHSYLSAQSLTAGTTIYAQFITRDVGSAQANNSSLTDALAITLAP